jgi:uncharacterized protein with HEPN domain
VIRRRDRQRLEDILQAISAINVYIARGTLDDALVFDAVQLNLIKIGEAVAALPDSIRERSQVSHGNRSSACATSSHTPTFEWIPL